MPQLVYFVTVLPTPAESLFLKLDKLLKNFIWGGSTKIKSAQMEKDIPGGGLKLTNLRFLNYSLKLSWIKRLVNTDGSWQSLFMHIFNIDKYRFWEFDIQSITEISLVQYTNPFWRDSMQIWIDFKNLHSDTDPRSYPPWGFFFQQEYKSVAATRYF